MDERSDVVEALPDRPLTNEERFAFARHDGFESIIPHGTSTDPETGEDVMHAALIVSAAWVTAVNYTEGEGWEAVYRGSMDENPVANGILSTTDLDDGHPIRQGMLALTEARPPEDQA